MVKMPRVSRVEATLKILRRDLDKGEELDIRLQVYPSGEWALRSGLSDYDQDHRGYWGASCIDSRTTVKELKTIAQDLISQADEMAGGEE